MLSRTVSGSKLREIREDREMTVAELADRAGADKTMVYKIETGDRQPSARLFGRICRALNVSKDDLLVPDDERQAS